jgi:hypothetical protein
MNQALGFSEATYDLGARIFFLADTVFELSAQRDHQLYAEFDSDVTAE